MTDKVLVLVTCGNSTEARRIARRVVERRLAACVNILEARVESIYRWKSKVETANEYLLLVKSSRELFPALRAEIERLHSYEVPEVIAVSIAQGSSGYLYWLRESLKAGEPQRRIASRVRRKKN